LPEHTKEIAHFFIFMTLGIYHRLIKKKKVVIVTDYGISEVKSSFVPNGVKLEASSKTSGIVAPTAKSSAL
jgi:SCY1-like protein 2